MKSGYAYHVTTRLEIENLRGNKLLAGIVVVPRSRKGAEEAEGIREGEELMHLHRTPPVSHPTPHRMVPGNGKPDSVIRAVAR